MSAKVVPLGRAYEIRAGTEDAKKRSEEFARKFERNPSAPNVQLKKAFELSPRPAEAGLPLLVRELITAEPGSFVLSVNVDGDVARICAHMLINSGWTLVTLGRHMPDIEKPLRRWIQDLMRQKRSKKKKK